ncbi:rho guanine nucleotide exchange factor 28 [Latimeria chalumnae]|uniref:rho guanine nucleotide exchange factor 28 n=1 Tax=Latimeria chalumnae TaxID=7897 RepID=UPI00313CB626
MELSCSQVPLYGQLCVYAAFEKVAHLPAGAEFYFVYQGSKKRHITLARRYKHNTLQSIVPGHDSLETVLVTACVHTEGTSFLALGCSTITYVQDKAHELSQFLASHVDCITSTSHLTVLAQFGLSVEDVQSLDENVTLAMAHLDMPSPWTVLGNWSGEELNHRETLLHLTARLGLVKLTKFVLSQPCGARALTVPNEEGVTPADLALQNGHYGLLEILSNPQNTRVTPPVGISTIRESSGFLLKSYEHFDTLTLTVDHTDNGTVETDIELLRKYLQEEMFMKKVSTFEGPLQKSVDSYKLNASEDSKNILSSGTSMSSETEDAKFFDDQMTISAGYEKLLSPDSEKRCSSSDVHKKSTGPPTFLAATRLSDMLNGRDEIYANYMVVDQVNDRDIKYLSVEGVTAKTTCTDHDISNKDGELQNSIYFVEANAPASYKDSSLVVYEHGEDERDLMNNLQDLDQSHNVSSQDFTLTGFPNTEEPSDSNINKQSSSLDANSEDEGNSDKSPSPYPSVFPSSAPPQASSGDELDSFETVPESDFNPIRTESIFSPKNIHSKESLDSGIRLRSYSCSSPKITVGKRRFIRDPSASDSSEEQRAYSLSDHSREKRIEEEDWDKYIIPTKNESEKYKVSRTFSFLKSRMTSTRNKTKSKNKDKEGKDKEKSSNGHQLITGSFSGLTPCVVCEKAVTGKDSLQCFNCTVNVHKSCRDSIPACTKKPQDKNQITKSRPAIIPQSLSLRDTSHFALPTMNYSSPLPIGSPSVKRDIPQQSHPLSKSASSAYTERKFTHSVELEMDSNTWRSRSQSEELLQVLGAPPSTDSLALEDFVDGPPQSAISALEFEAESWSLVVDPSFCNKQEKAVVKRQDVIYELMQTEMHHIQTLNIMSEIFRKGMKEELQIEHNSVDKIFPCLDELLEIHKHFFCCMKDRRQESFKDNNERNFLIDRIGDILVQQFSEENGNKMKQVYGDFCSRHKEAVNLFKELLQQNKKFQNFIKQQSNNFLARRLGVPECILLVTQRITKYPVLVERILRYSREGTEEHQSLTKALGLIKDIIAAVDLKVNEYEKEQKLLEILNKIENKTYTKLKSGWIFRKQDLMSRKRILLYEGLVYWKTATGRLKDILALLLSDVLLFLQEKDQKYIFATVDQKPPVIFLQKLIVREVANEERGMFLISASSAGPEMYEIHTSSKEERNNWMRLIREAVESCPEEEEDRTSETEEEKRITARVAKIHRFQESLTNQDQQICSSLAEKLQIYAELAGMSGCEEVNLDPQLLVKPEPGETPQAALLLDAALREAESLCAALTSQPYSFSRQSQESFGEPVSPLKPSAFGSFNSIPESSTECDSTTQSPSSLSLASDPDNKDGGEWYNCDPAILQPVNEIENFLLAQKENFSFKGTTHAEIVQSIQNLTQLLYSLQTAVTIQDSYIEVQKLLLLERERMNRSHGSRGNLLLEQEKQRNLEKRKEELANVHKLQGQLQQEQQRWQRECHQRQREQEEKESWLLEKEQECKQLEEVLHRDKEELDLQLREYQQNLERLREGQKLVEKDREKLETQQKLLNSWRHSRQSSLPVTFSLENNQVISHSRISSLIGEGSVFINETAVQMSLQSHNISNAPMIHSEQFCRENSLSSQLARTSDNQASNVTGVPIHSVTSSRLWNTAGVHHQVPENPPSLPRRNTDFCNNDLNYKKDSGKECLGLKSRSSSSPLLLEHQRLIFHQDFSTTQLPLSDSVLLQQSNTEGPYPGYTPSQLSVQLLLNPQLDLLPDVENGEGSEENIVYL